MLALMALALFGCAKPESKAASDATKTPESASNLESKPPEEPKGLPISSVPADLKTEAFSYYGLENLSPIEYEVISSAIGAPQTGTSTTTLAEVKDDIARFVTSRTGEALSQMGDEEVEARKDGVYNTKIGGHPVEPAQLVLPSDLAAGKTWSTKGKVTAQTAQGLKTFDQSFEYKVIGTEKVKTKAGEFDSLKVTAKGTITVDGKKNQSEVVAWYVKRVGTVKMDIRSSGDRKVSMTIEATKVPG